MTSPQPDSRTSPRKSGAVVTFDNPAAYAQTVRATALVFEDPQSKALEARVDRIAPSDASALIIGETGTGKELIARQLHRLSPRAGGPFVALNCGALPENLVESELFGHEKGAFTGAIAQKKGWFEAAHGGTLFLDEIGDLPLATQVKLLRVLQEREVTRIGGRTAVPIDVRLVAATNVELEGAVLAGRFRQDLYYRLNVAKIHLPPLRERPGDILPLCEHFIGVYRDRFSTGPITLAEETRHILVNYPWPGNIRELENVIHHALIVMSNDVISPRDLNLSGYSLQNATALAGADAARPIDLLEKALLGLFETAGDGLYAGIDEKILRVAYAYCHNNQVQTARLLGISRNILRHRLKLYGLL